MKPRRYAAIILAAGFSRRMEQFKPLLSLGEETITDHMISTLLQNDVEVYLVVGWRGDELRASIKKRDIKIIENHEYRQGMLTSIQAGIRHLQPVPESFFIMPVDIPLVRPSTISRLLSEAKEHPGKIIYPTFGKVRGHPPLLPSSLISAILEWQKDGGLKALLDEQANIALEIQVPDSNILFDIDTPEDYDAMLKRFQRYDVPTDDECEVILLDVCKIPQDIYRHCLKVAEVAEAIGKALVEAGEKPDLAVVRAAAMLHDIAKGQPKHDATGGQILQEMGFGKVGEIVAIHTDLPAGNSSISLESKIVYLADKYVKGEDHVSLDERYHSAGSKYGLNLEIMRQRKLRALKVKQELDDILGYSLDAIIF